MFIINIYKAKKLEKLQLELIQSKKIEKLENF
jgi:hypothetical protein